MPTKKLPFEIRPYQPSDLNALYEICLLTADGGKDASHLFADKKLVGHFYAAPYGVFEPDVCFIVTHNEKPCGFVVGTRCSQRFAQRCENEWFPQLRAQFPLLNSAPVSLNDKLISYLHQGYQPRPEYRDYPAHLHINLLPETQGHGIGRKLMETFIENLKQLNVSGLHLEVSASNQTAIRFYEKMGFSQIAQFEHSFGYGIKF
ncbi:GNAT family N-acetyltransferase [Motilimonas cestriensis]|uniref:GNAT family N-acetyltransferase n=1 Tax=Motilimonas cestriensis TaxID=2742685 RepID=UPI003DA458B7